MPNNVLLDRLIGLLGAEPHPQKAQIWQYRCWSPTHKRGDQNPSGEIFVCNGNACFGCWCCSYGAGKETARAYRNATLAHYGTSWRELLRGTDDGDWRTVVAQHQTGFFDYSTHEGWLAYQKVRVEPGKFGRPKDFFFRRPAIPETHPSNLDKASWTDGLGDTPHLLYQLPKLISALKADTERVVAIVEGEAKADFLWTLGIAATSTDGGAGGAWLPEYSEILGGRRVVLVPDNDACGWKHMAEIAFALQAYDCKIQWLKLPGLKDSEDILDWAAVLKGLDFGTVELSEKFLAMMTQSPIL